MDPLTGAALITGGASLLGGLIGRKSAKSTNRMNYMLQKEFAQKGIQWKVADAKAAGIHPLAALGAQTHSPTVAMQDTGMGQAVSMAGRSAAHMMMQKQMIEGTELDNAIKSQQFNLIMNQADRERIKYLIERDAWLNDSGQDQADVPDMFIPVKDNFTGKIVMMPNPQLTIEGHGAIETWKGQKSVRRMNEQHGTGYFLE